MKEIILAALLSLTTLNALAGLMETGDNCGYVMNDKLSGPMTAICFSPSGTIPSPFVHLRKVQYKSLPEGFGITLNNKDFNNLGSSWVYVGLYIGNVLKLKEGSMLNSNGSITMVISGKRYTGLAKEIKKANKMTFVVYGREGAVTMKIGLHGAAKALSMMEAFDYTVRD